MSLRDDLRPVGRNRVIDLVQAAGIDVSDWSNSSRGPRYASVNPKYCYNWSFVGADGTAVLNLWFRNIVERRGIISVETNLRELAEDLRSRNSKHLWIERAKKMDEALMMAANAKARLRVIINDGDMRDIDDPEEKASVVRGRMLDPLPWTIVSYSRQTGDAVLRRGVMNGETVDQFSVDGSDSGLTERVDIFGKAFVRDAAVRAAVRSRAAGRCEYCDMPGFVTLSGKVFLETHHIVPLSEGGADTVFNVAAICPNHHREAHHGTSAPVIREYLLKVAGGDRRGVV